MPLSVLVIEAVRRAKMRSRDGRSDGRGNYCKSGVTIFHDGVVGCLFIMTMVFELYLFSVTESVSREDAE